MMVLAPDPKASYRNVADALIRIVRTEGPKQTLRGIEAMVGGARLVAEEFASELKSLARSSGCLIGIVIDAGVPYQRYKGVFERQGFPVFDGMDMGVLGINVLKNSR